MKSGRRGSREFALQGGTGIARLEGIAGKDHEIDIAAQTVIDNFVEAA